MFWTYAANLQETPYALQPYWNHTSAWVFSCWISHIFGTPFLHNTSGGLLLRRLLTISLSKYAWFNAQSNKKGKQSNVNYCLTSTISYHILLPINANNSFLRKSQKQSWRGVLRQRCSENMLKIYRFFLQKNFIEIALRHEFSCQFAAYF